MGNPSLEGHGIEGRHLDLCTVLVLTCSLEISRPRGLSAYKTGDFPVVFFFTIPYDLRFSLRQLVNSTPATNHHRMKSYADSYDSELAQQSIGGSSLPGSTPKFSLLSLYPGHQGGEDILLKEELKTTQDLLDKFTKWDNDPECRFGEKLGTGNWGHAAKALLTRHLNTVKNTQQRRTDQNNEFGTQLGDRFSGEDRECLASMRDNGEEADNATQRQIVNDPDLKRELSRYSGEVQSTCRARIIFSAPQSAAISDAADRFTEMITTRGARFGHESCYQCTKDLIYEMRGRKLHDLYSILLGKPFCTYSNSCGQCHSG